jgi:hypothetical protein
MATGARSAVRGIGGRGLLAVCWFLGVLGCLGHVLVQLRNSLTFTMPSPIILSIRDSANLKQYRACLLSMLSERGGMLTSALRLCTSVAL